MGTEFIDKMLRAGSRSTPSNHAAGEPTDRIALCAQALIRLLADYGRARTMSGAPGARLGRRFSFVFHCEEHGVRMFRRRCALVFARSCRIRAHDVGDS